MSAIFIMFGLGYVFHLAYKGVDKVVIVLIDTFRKKKNSEVV